MTLGRHLTGYHPVWDTDRLIKWTVLYRLQEYIKIVEHDAEVNWIYSLSPRSR